MKWNEVVKKEIGILDMVIAFDTTGSMAAYIDAVRQEVAELIPGLFKDNENLQLGIVAFGVSVPFSSGHKTARLVEAATMVRGSEKSRAKFDEMASECVDEEMRNVFRLYGLQARNNYD